jgi:hypothetical protein
LPEKPIVHLICNVHLDPVWKWPWEEGAREAIFTFRTAADLLDEFPEFVFNHNESLLYEWVEEYDPPLFRRICALVEGGAGISPAAKRWWAASSRGGVTSPKNSACGLRWRTTSIRLGIRPAV